MAHLCVYACLYLCRHLVFNLKAREREEKRSAWDKKRYKLCPIHYILKESPSVEGADGLYASSRTCSITRQGEDTTITGSQSWETAWWPLAITPQSPGPFPITSLACCSRVQLRPLSHGQRREGLPCQSHHLLYMKGEGDSIFAFASGSSMTWGSHPPVSNAGTRVSRKPSVAFQCVYHLRGKMAAKVAVGNSP